MTACFNKKNEAGKNTPAYTKAVSATLASALAVGMIPGMALAADDGIIDLGVDSSLELLVADEAVDVAKGDITEATDNEGNAIDLKKDIKFTVGEETMYVVPTMVETLSDGTYDPEDGIVCYYAVDEEGTFENMPWAKEGEKLTLITDPENYGWGIGEYYVTVSSDEATSPESATAIKFEIEAGSLDGAYLFEGDDVEDKIFTYTGEDLASTIGLTFGKEGDLVKGVDYTVAVISDYEDDELDGTMIAADEYVVRVTGINNYAGFKKDYKVEVGAMDLSSVDVALTDTCKLFDVASDAVLAPAIASINDGVAVNDQVALEFKESSEGKYLTDPVAEKGSYTFTLAAADDEDTNFKNSQDITLVRYDAEAEIEYDGEAMGGALDADVEFDADEITVKDADGEDLPFDVKYEKAQADGSYAEVEADDITKPGDYRVTVTVDSADEDVDYAFGGQAQLTFHIAALEINADENVFVSYEGDEGYISSKQVEYTGSDLSENFKVKVYDNDGELLVEGTDYAVKFVDAEGEEVSELVNVGEYTLVIEAAEGSMYEFIGVTEVPVEIEAIGVDPVVANMKDLGYQTGLVYTGSAIVPEFKYLTDDNDTPFNTDDDVYADLDSDLYTMTYKMYNYYTDEYVEVDSIIEAGSYEITITFNEDVDNFKFVGGYDFDGGKSCVAYVDVIDIQSFADVPSGKWFSEVVYEVSQPGGYMFGYSGTKLFGPYDEVIRGDVAVVLFRMAGGENWAESDSVGGLDSWNSFETPFKDVKESKYYAEAIAWAAKTGVVKGYGNGDYYGPEDELTREQFAVMLQRYAELNGDYEPVDDPDTVLDFYLDGDSVSKWAKPAVAWACANGYMGLNTEVLNPQGDIIRAELAAMTVRYQPVEPQEMM